MEALNRSLFLLINAGADPAPWSLWLATVLAQWLIYLILPLLAVLWLWGRRSTREAVLLAALSLLLALGCNLLIFAVSFHPRPFMIPLGHNFLPHKAETSFPSDHAVVFFSVGLGLVWGQMRRLGAWLVALGVAVGASRVYLGVHFPFDIIGALLVATASSWAVLALLNTHQLKARLLDGAQGLYRRVFALPITKGWVQD
ncbi:phosphatase PAP2 family protein [Pseudomonas abieticivorans]|uniref:phosphatase PAP2 family protein n=1 Tax=Pseudomonas abieticivorans TaxID=2931382 RepID=UPI0020C1199B|nr:phosphatase PAP2 family protein [Pseudomonas sp. PIA16]